MAACAESGDYEKAFACYDLAAGSDPGNVTAYIRAGLLHPERGEVSEAKECAEQALAADTTSPDAWAIRCGIDAAAGDVVAFEPDAFYAEVYGAIFPAMLPVSGICTRKPDRRRKLRNTICLRLNWLPADYNAVTVRAAANE